MKRKTLLFLLLLALLAPWAAKAENLTVHDGTTTNGYVPVYGFYADAYLKCEMVYPATELNSTMKAGSQIQSLTYYLSSPAEEAWTGSWRVYLSEVNSTTISDFYGGGTWVYQGTLDGTGNVMSITFDRPYIYNGGNLLVGVYLETEGNYKSASFYGETVSNSSVQGYSYSSLSAISPTQRNFLPKTTFTYVPVVTTYTLTTTANPVADGTTQISTTYDFNNSINPWTIIDRDGDGYNWVHGSGFVHSESAHNYASGGTYTPLSPDNYLVSPQVQLGGRITFSACAQDANYAAEHFGVAVSTDGTNFTTIQEWTMTANGTSRTAGGNEAVTTIGGEERGLRGGNRTQGTWGTFSADLSSYAGQTGYVAIRHFNCYDQFWLDIDNITIVEPGNPEASIVVTSGQSCTATATPNSGYTFINWTENNSQVSASTSYSTTVSANRNLVANFSAPPIDVVVGTNEGTDYGSYLPVHFYYNNSLTQQIYKPSEIGYTGNIKQLSFYYSTGTSETRTIAIYMKMTTANTLSAFDSNPGTLVYSGSYTFSGTGWQNIPLSGNGFNYNDICENLMITVDMNGTYTSSRYFATYNTGENRALYKYDDSTNFDPTSPPSSPSTSQYNNHIKLTIANTTEYKILTAKSNDLTMGSFSLNPSGTNCTSGNYYAYATGTSVSLTAVPNTGHSFVNWTVDGSTVTGNPTTVTMSANHNVVANFEPITYQVSVTAGTGGSVSGGGSYTHNQGCTVTATPNSNYCFLNWTENGSVVSTASSYSFLVTANRNLTANFVSLNPNSISVSGTTVTCGNSATLTASGLSNVIYNWYSDAECTQLVQANSATLTTPVLTSNTTYYVKAVGGNSLVEDARSFTYTGSSQSFTIPSGTLFAKLEVWGAQGGGQQVDGNTNGGVGGKGGYSVGTLSNLSGLSSIYVYVGGQGGTSNSQSEVSAPGGWNGGGTAFGSSSSDPGCGGGGATDIRLNGSSLYYRVLVAGGGGGGGEDSEEGGYGGGTTGGTGYYSSTTGGTQTDGGTGYAFGIGASTPYDGGAGGGGWYGGGCGGGTQTIPTSNSSDDSNGGCGGSGYVWTAATARYAPSSYSVSSSYYLVNAQTIAGNASMPNPDGGTMTGRQGNGYARITLYTVEPCEGQAKAVTVTVNQPAAPTNVQVTNIGLTTATASWSGSASSYSYSIDGTNWTTTNNTTASLSGLTPGQTYTFQVKAVGNGTCESEVASTTFTTPNTHTLTASVYPANSGTISTNGTIISGATTYTHGTEVQLTATPNTGYDFIGWTVDGSSEGITNPTTVTMDQDHSVVANFELQRFDISASANPSAGGSVSGAGTYDYNTSCTLSTMVNNGYTFTGWFENNSLVSTSTSYTFTVTAAHTLEARFTQDTYSVSVSANPAEGGTVSGGGDTFTYNASCTVTATANSGYTFSGWYENNSLVSDNANYTFTVTAAHALEARFGADQTLTTYVNPIEGGYVTITPVSNINAVTVGTGTTGSTYVPFSTAVEYSFVETLYTSSELGSAGTITSISYELNGSQSSSNNEIEVYLVHTSKANFSNSHDFIEVTANDKVFEGTWNIPGSGWATIVLDKPFQYNGTDNLMIGINEKSSGTSARSFNQETVNHSRVTCYGSVVIDPTVSNFYNGAGLDYSRGNQRANVRLGFGTYHYGQSVTLTAHANKGYQFVNWTENSTEVGTHGDATYTVTMDADHTIYANFERALKRFVTDGYWNVAGNWDPVGVPTSDISEDISIEANAIIPDGVVAYADSIRPITHANSSITIEDGGQLIHNSAGLSLTAEKNITGYTEPHHETNWNYYLFSSPVTANATYSGIVTEQHYDLYSFNASADPLEWILSTPSDLAPYTGFIYASRTNTTISVTGTVPPSNTTPSHALDYTSGRFIGWNLIGNPFVCNAYVTNANNADMDYYVLYNNDESHYDEFVTASSSDPVAPLSALMVKASATGQSVTYSRTAPGKGAGILNIDVRAMERDNSLLDRARVRFGEGRNLEKFQFDTRHTKVYIPEGNDDFSVYYAQGAGTIPVNFKAENNGRYTLDFSTEDVGFNYLHLIDNMNGNDVDLLQTPYYAFNAKSTDFASRFTLVFATGNDNDGNFAFFNNGVWIINNDGKAELQVVDALGRILSSETISGSCSKAINAAPGVYMLRLINGNDVKVQKVVVRR